MLHNILRQNAVNCVLKRRLTAVGPFSHNKSHISVLGNFEQCLFNILFCRSSFEVRVVYFALDYCFFYSVFLNLDYVAELSVFLVVV